MLPLQMGQGYFAGLGVKRGVQRLDKTGFPHSALAREQADFSLYLLPDFSNTLARPG